MKKKLNVKSKIHNYSVYFEKHINKIFQSLPKESVYIVDNFVYKNFLKQYLKNKKFICINSNERNKDFISLPRIINFFINNVSKDTKVISVGGGVIQDITSFICSIFKRGVEWFFIPTTIISQGDSCIGGKTSINYQGVKNQLGNFNPPKKIILNPNFIKKLPKKEFFSGLGEMGHYFFLSNKKDYLFYKNSLKKINDKKKLDIYKIIFKSLSIKKKYIEKDEFDKNIRLNLNYGHTFGHAIENLTNLPHGISVAHGMDISNYISFKNNFITYKTYLEMRETLDMIIKHYKIKQININKMLHLIKKDKKSTKKNIRVILTKGIGKMLISKINDKVKFMNDLIEYCHKNKIKI